MKLLERSDTLQTLLNHINELTKNIESLEFLDQTFGRIDELLLKTYDTSVSGIVNMETYVVDIAGVYQVRLNGDGISRILIVNGFTGSRIGEEIIPTSDSTPSNSKKYSLAKGDKIIITLSPRNNLVLKGAVYLVGSLYSMFESGLDSLQQSTILNEQIAEDTSALIERQTELNEATQEIVDHYLTQISSLQADYVDLISRFQLLSGYAIGGYEITIPFREWKKKNASYTVIVKDENVFAETEIRACLVRVIWDDDSLKKILRRMKIESNTEGGTFKIAIKERPLGDITGTVTFSPVYKRSIVD